MALTQYYVRPTNGNDIAGQGTTHATAYQTTQFALNDIGGTHGRDAVNGDQVNICGAVGEGADVLGAALNLAGYGVPAEGAPLVLRGYTAVANDDGRGHISHPSNAIINASGTDYICMVDMELEGGGNPTRLLTLDDYNLFLRCKFIPNRGGAAVAYGIDLDNANQIIDCEFCDDNGYGFASAAATLEDDNLVALCYFHARGRAVSPNYRNTILQNLVIVTYSCFAIDLTYDYNVAIGNAVYSSAANTQAGILLGNAGGRQNGIALNNIVVGWSGVGGAGIEAKGGDILVAGGNAFYNNTADYAVSDIILVDLTANDVALGADPFVNAAAGNFMLTDVAKAALRSAGWPASYLGAAATDPHLTIGPVQYGEAAGGGGYMGRGRWHGV